MPLFWDSSLENRNTVTAIYGPPSPGPYALETVGRVSVTSTLLVPAFAIGYRINDDFGLGLSLLLPYYSHRQERNTSEVSVTRGTYRSYWEIQEQTVAGLRLGAGAYRTLGGLDLGFSMKSPSVRLLSSSQAEWHSVFSSFASGTTLTSDAHIEDGEADFRSPFEATVAVGWIRDRWSLEADLTYLAHVAAYQTVEGGLPITSRRFNTSTGFDVTTRSTGTPGTLELGDAWNVAIGSSFAVTPAVGIHLGFATDRSQVENSNEYTALDIRTVNMGLLYKTVKNSMFLGGYRQWSNEGDVRVFNTGTSLYESAHVSFTATGLVLGASYYLD